ncbi:beta-1,3-galactosyltransferase 2-like [Colossoma macropomum]|uniref:beta-1,3-galactosyltransferase 2-like n=1 Tax=Colossoma macropomum TaxID=42526 RepID=UPI0018647A18|nr:beta-1,3-galactosyltransferase 2-like [Colossoma macropomum]
MCFSVNETAFLGLQILTQQLIHSSTVDESEHQDPSNRNMQWKWRHCCTSIAGFLVLLLCVGVFLIVSEHSLLAGKKSHQEYGVTHIPPRSEGNLSSILEDSSQQGLKNSVESNASLSKEVRAGNIPTIEPYNYIINEEDKCQEKNPFLVLLITVEPQNVQARDAIRQTWGNESVAEGLGFVRLFLFGMTEGLTSQLQRSIEAESQQHHDIIQQKYIDTYYNLTIKTLMGMHWIATYCPGASYVTKTDSDMFVNTEYLIQKLLNPNLPQKRKYFTGYLLRGEPPHRNKDSKWYMSPELYPDHVYPTFCSGTGYVISGDLAELIYRTSLSTRRLHLEDVYVAICLAKLRIEPVPPPNKSLFNVNRVPYSSCKYSNLITSHGLLPAEIIKYWQDLQSNKHNACDNTE